MTPSIKLTYFDIEGVAEPVRLALVLTKTPFEDERVKHPDWPALKPTTKYGQLPVMSIDGAVVAQSGAMLRYVGKTFDDGALYPAEKVMQIEEAIGLIDDLGREWSPALYVAIAPERLGYDAELPKTDAGKAKSKEMREAFVKDGLPKYAKWLSALIESSGAFLCGDKPTIADCLLLPNLRKFRKGYIDHVPTNCLDEYTTLVAWIDRMMAIPEIKEWYSKH